MIIRGGSKGLNASRDDGFLGYVLVDYCIVDTDTED